MTTVNQTGIITKLKQERENTVSIVDEKKTLHTLLEKRKGEIQKALPSTVSLDRFMRVAFTALDKTPNLYKCSESSFYGAIMLCAQIGLEPNTPLGLAYLVPYNNANKAKELGVAKYFECNFQIGYKGLLDLAYRSGEMATIQAHIVYENDTFEYELGIEPILKHKPAPSNRGNMTYAYAMFHLKNGGKSFIVMSKDDIIKFGKRYSKTYDAGPWQTDFEAMAKKTVLKQLLKTAPIRSDFLTDAEATDGVTTLYDEKDGKMTYINEETGEITEINEIKETENNE